jgi:modulator of FtsH protease HflK
MNNRPFETVVHFPDLGKRLSGFRPRGPMLRIFLLGFLALLFIFTAVYQVEPEEKGVVMRFGEFVRTAEPGLHFKLPLGIEQVLKVPVERQLKQEFGFRTERPGVRTQYSNEPFDDVSLMLTGDLNIADVEWVVQYRIVDPERYLFRVRNIEDTFRDMSEAIMREVVGDRTINEVLTVGRQEIASLVEVQLQELADQYETGLKVEQVVLQNVNPPEAVKASFNEVNQAEQEREQKINAAQAVYNQVIPRARGEAEQAVSQAEGYALDRVNRAQGDAARFRALYAAYSRAPEVTRKRMYLETLSEMLPRAERKIVVGDSVEGLLPLLPLGVAATPPAAAPRGGGG